MIVIVVERATPGLRGQLTRWMLEVKAGVFVGTLSSRVRDKLWALVKVRNPNGGSVLVARAPNEQGFVIETHGDTSRQVFESEGLWLVRKPAKETRSVRGQAAPEEGEDPAPKRKSGRRKR